MFAMFLWKYIDMFADCVFFFLKWKLMQCTSSLIKSCGNCVTLSPLLPFLDIVWQDILLPEDDWSCQNFSSIVQIANCFYQHQHEFWIWTQLYIQETMHKFRICKVFLLARGNAFQNLYLEFGPISNPFYIKKTKLRFWIWIWVQLQIVPALTNTRGNAM